MKKFTIGVDFAPLIQYLGRPERDEKNETAREYTARQSFYKVFLSKNVIYDENDPQKITGYRMSSYRPIARILKAGKLTFQDLCRLISVPFYYPYDELEKMLPILDSLPKNTLERLNKELLRFPAHEVCPERETVYYVDSINRFLSLTRLKMSQHVNYKVKQYGDEYRAVTGLHCNRMHNLPWSLPVIVYFSNVFGYSLHWLFGFKPTDYGYSLIPEVNTFVNRYCQTNKSTREVFSSMIISWGTEGDIENDRA